MYGNENKPGVRIYDGYRDDGTIWVGYPEATWFENSVQVKNATPPEFINLPLGAVLTQIADGSYAPLKVTDIAASAATLPGNRLVIVADKRKKLTVEDEDIRLLAGKAGVVDRRRLSVEGTMFEDLTESQQMWLKNMLEVWGFSLSYVEQV